MLSLASRSHVTSHVKAPLNVVLIIDTHMPPSIDELQTKRAVMFLRRSLIRILLYFQCNMDANFQWTFQFFNSRLHQDIGLTSNRMLQSLSMNSVDNCVEEFRRIIASELLVASSSGKGGFGTGSGPGSDRSVSPCYNLRRQLVHSLADFGLDIASYQSPMKPTATFLRSQSVQKHFPPINIRNYIYVLSPLPQSWTDIVFFLEGKRQPQKDFSTIGPRRSDILDVLNGVKEAFFEQGLWDRFLDQHTSLSWIDTSNKGHSEDLTKASTKLSAVALIRSTLELIMTAFGGHIIPQHILCQSLLGRDIYSFATIFQAFRSLHIHPGLGVKMSKDNWQALPSASDIVPLKSVHPVNIVWSGDLLCSESSQCIMSHPKILTMDSGSTPMTGPIKSLHVVKRFASRVLNSKLHSIKIASTMICFPGNSNSGPCEHGSYLLKSLRAKNDVLLLRITFQSLTQEGSGSNGEVSGQDRSDTDGNNNESHKYTFFALLHATVPGSGLVEVLQGDNGFLTELQPTAQGQRKRGQPFSMAMLEKSWSNLGAFIGVEEKRVKSGSAYQLDSMPSCIMKCFKLQPIAQEGAIEPRCPVSRPLPGEMVADINETSLEIEQVETIDDLCLGIRKTYIKYLYNDETVTDYVKRLNAASKEITALAAKQLVPLKEAQQKLIAFIIEFLRIWPSRMGSKYRQIAKELNIGKFTDSKSQDNYVILEDERPHLDAWKAHVMKNVKDANVRLSLKKLKTKDTQIQVVQNLHILLLINKYDLEENRPFKKDPGASKALNLFMDELCIAASLEDQPTPGLMSPQTPRSKDMDSAKKFFVRVISRYYELSLPKIVQKLSVKCGVEKSLLTSPKSSRSARRTGIQRSISMGILQKPTPLDLSSLVLEDDSSAPSTSKSSASAETDTVTPKYGFPMSRQPTSDNTSKNVLNSSIFRNRQVVMTRGSVQGVATTLSTNSAPSAAAAKPNATSIKPAAALLRAKTMSSMDDLEDEDAPPKIARLKLKKFYHDKESEEVLKLFRRQRPLSKADAIETNPFLASETKGRNVEGGGDYNNDDDDLGALGKYLPGNGTTTWGAIKSVNMPNSSSVNVSSSSINDDILKSPSMLAAQNRVPLKSRGSSLSGLYGSTASLPIETIVPTTPLGGEGLGSMAEGPRTPSTPTGRTQLRRYASQQVFGTEYNQSLNSSLIVPSTPSRRVQIQEGRNFASQIRGSSWFEADLMGSPGKRSRAAGGSGSDDEDTWLDEHLPRSPSLGLHRRRPTAALSPSYKHQGRRAKFFEELRSIRPDRKRVHLEAPLNEKSPIVHPKTLVPGTPPSSLPTTLSGGNVTMPWMAKE
ncbi:hypothetical protein BX616_003501 [Lobosporangium transversale]|nr:hypothetical protein BX616_003501 [Lobosporangium transversale]